MASGSLRPGGMQSPADLFDAALRKDGMPAAVPPLAALSTALQGPAYAPRADFRAELRARLMDAALTPAAAPAAGELASAVTRVRPATPSTTVRRIRLRLAARVAAGLATATCLVGGIGVASAHALPGDALYGVKRATETAQYDLTSGDSDRGLLRLRFAATRLSEVRGLIARAGGLGDADAAALLAARRPSVALPAGIQGRITSTLAAMDAETDEGASLLTRAYLKQNQTVALSRLASFTTRQETQLTQVLPVLPAAAGQTSLFVLHAVADRTNALLATSPRPVGTLPPASSPGAAPSATAAPNGEPATSNTPAAGESPRSSTSPSPASAADASPTSAPGTSGPPGSAPHPSPGPGKDHPAPSGTAQTPEPTPSTSSSSATSSTAPDQSAQPDPSTAPPQPQASRGDSPKQASGANPAGSGQTN